MDRKALGQRIRIARKDCGLTGEKLAERCSINATYLRQLESGAKIPSLPLFISLCIELRVSPDYLLSGELAGAAGQDLDCCWLC